MYRDDDDPFRAVLPSIERVGSSTGCFYYIQRGTTFNFPCMVSSFVGRPGIGTNLELFDRLLERVWHDEAFFVVSPSCCSAQGPGTRRFITFFIITMAAVPSLHVAQQIISLLFVS